MLAWFYPGDLSSLSVGPQQVQNPDVQAMGPAGKEPKARGAGVLFTAQHHPATAPSAAQKPLRVEPLLQSFYSQGLEWTRGAGKSLGCFCPTPRSASSTLDWALCLPPTPARVRVGRSTKPGVSGSSFGHCFYLGVHTSVPQSSQHPLQAQRIDGLQG